MAISQTNYVDITSAVAGASATGSPSLQHRRITKNVINDSLGAPAAAGEIVTVTYGMLGSLNSILTSADDRAFAQQYFAMKTTAPANNEHPGTTLYFTGNAIANSSSSNQPVDSDATEGQGEVEPAGFAEVATETPAEEYVSYKNCTAVREAGAAPIHRGEPGYASHLDRDNDGIGCE